MAKKRNKKLVFSEKETSAEETSNTEESAQKKEGFFELSKLSWAMLLFVDAVLFIYTLFFRDIFAGVAALALAILIEKKGTPVLLADYNARQERQRKELTNGVKLTSEQKKEVIKEFRRERAEKKAQKKAEREARTQ